MFSWGLKFVKFVIKFIINIIEKLIIPIAKLICIIIILFSIPFILPVICKFLINLGVFIDFSEFEKVGNFFNGWYTLVYIGIGLFLFVISFDGLGEIKEFFRNRDFSLNFKDKIFSTSKNGNEELQRADEQKAFINQIDEGSKKVESNVAQQLMKLELGMSNNTAMIDCSNCNRVDLEKENNRLREFATYKVINPETKCLLHIIYNEKYIETEKFKGKIVRGYKKRFRKNQNMSQSVVNKLANNKFETILEGLTFLNIIEPSEDDKILKLTKEGKAYVEKYIENKEDEEK